MTPPLPPEPPGSTPEPAGPAGPTGPTGTAGPTGPGGPTWAAGGTGAGGGWPLATLSPVARARALAAALPGAGYAETTIDAPFAEAWAIIADLERSVPDADTTVRSLRIRSRRVLEDERGASIDGPVEQLRLFAWANPPIPLLLDARLEPGYCLMRVPGRLFVIVMAAEPHPTDPTRTIYGHVEVVPRALGRPLRRLLDRVVAGDAAGFRRHVEERIARP